MGGWNLGWLGLAPKKWNKAAKNFLTGEPGKINQVSTLTPGQEPLHEQLINAGMGPGAGGAFGDVADYYRGNLSDNPKDFDAFAAPALRQYNEDIVPGLSEQFAGMGAGGLNSSGFRNAQIQGATDLSERLGALRANLRMQSAQGLMNVGQAGLNPVQQNIQTEGTPGFLPQAAQGAGAALTAYATGNPMLAAGGGWFGGKGQQVAKKKSPYGGKMPASPQIGNPGFQLPGFLEGQGGY